MTASKGNLGGGASKTTKVVSSTLAGVLAVGMIPAAGFAAEAADEGVEGADIELLDALSPADNFSQGTISALTLSDGTATPVAGQTNQFTTVYNSATPFTVTAVTAALQDTTALTADDDYTGPVVTDAAGNTVTEISTQGTYTITITGAKNTEFAGATLSATLEVTAVSFADTDTAAIAVYNADTISDSASTWADYTAEDSFMYTGEAQNVGIVYAPVTGGTEGTPVALQEGVDYTVTYYISGTETAVSSIENAGDYYARVTGIGKYSGTINTAVFTVDPLNLASTDPAVSLVFGDGGYVYGASTNLPTHPSSVTIGDKTYTNSNILNAIVVDEWSDATGATPAGRPGAFTGTAEAVVGNTNVDDSKTGAAAVTRVQNQATINYKNTPLSSVSQPVVLNSSDNQSWSDSDITVFNGTTKLEQAASTEAGKYTITWAKASAPGTVVTAPGAGDTGEFIVTISGIDSTNYTWAAYGTLEVTLIDGVIDCNTNLTVYYDGKNVKEINAIYDNGTDLVAKISEILLDNDKNVLTKDTDYKVTYKDADGKTVTEIENAGAYTLEVTSDKYQLLNNTVAITVAPETVTGLQMDATKLVSVNGQPAFNSTDAAPTVTDILDSTIQYKTNKTEAAAANAKAAWTAVTDATPLANFTFAITGPDGKAVDLSKGTTVLEPGTYTVSLKATDAENANYAGEATCTFNVAVQQKFQDVPADAWYYDYVNDVTSDPLNYMKGYAGTDTFGPNDNIIRGDVAVVLFRMAGGTQGSNADFSQDEIGGYVTGFADCDATAETRGMYYNQAIAWAKANGIVTGYAGTDEFRPQNKVTREEFATMLTRYAALSKDTSATNDLSKYPDGSTVSDWAKAAMEYVTAQGIMNGIGSTDEVLGPLAPQANVTRAEVAKMVYVEQPKSLGTSPSV